MRTYAIRMGYLLALAAVLHLDRPAEAQVPRPFRLQGAGALGFNPQVTPTGPFQASGYATHLGKWTNSGTLTFTPTGGFGTVTFVAADGAVLTGSFTGTIVQVN